MRFLLLFFLLVATGTMFAQTDSVAPVEDIMRFQQELDKEYRDKQHSPLEAKERRKFKGHKFFPVDLKYRVIAKYEKIENPVVFKMKTTTERLPDYVKYAKVTFQIDEKQHELFLYQSLALRQKPGYENYLFLPFTDLTNSRQTYGGGRFLDLEIPEGDTIIIDFNKAYNPYCAYNHKYSCPITPAENDLDTEIRAGVMLDKKAKK